METTTAPALPVLTFAGDFIHDLGGGERFVLLNANA